MRYLLLLALAGCPDAPKPMPDAEPFGMACVLDGLPTLQTCAASDGEIGWCIDSVCRRGCIHGECPYGGDPMPVYNDCYCK